MLNKSIIKLFVIAFLFAGVPVLWASNENKQGPPEKANEVGQRNIPGREKSDKKPGVEGEKWWDEVFEDAGRPKDASARNTNPGTYHVGGLEVEPEPIDYRTGAEETHVRKLTGLKKFTNITMKRGSIDDAGFYDTFAGTEQSSGE
ncbi:MAG: phage tail protein [Candidatus Omnitrophota bacterium]|nr:phage tail protein [Candidatus Omnitrophota bacterium]